MDREIKKLMRDAESLQTKVDVCKKMLEARMCELDAHCMLNDSKLVEHSRIACVSAFEALLDATVHLRKFMTHAINEARS